MPLVDPPPDSHASLTEHLLPQRSAETDQLLDWLRHTQERLARAKRAMPKRTLSEYPKLSLLVLVASAALPSPADAGSLCRHAG